MLEALAALLAFVYWLGYRRRLHLLGGGWGTAESRALLFYGGLATAVLVELPVTTDFARAYFWVRTSQVMALVMVSAPLLVLGSTRPVLARVLPALAARRSPRLDSRAGLPTAAVAFALLNAALWLWHVPAVYDAALGPGAGVADCAFLACGFLFWSQVIDQPPERANLSYLARAVYLVLASMQIRFLALFVGFAHAPFYLHYVQQRGAAAALIDQQLGAGIMLVPGIITDLVALTACLFLWLADEDRRAQHERPAPQPGRRALPVAAGSTR